MHGRLPIRLLLSCQPVDSNGQIWDIFEGGNLFTGQDPEHKTYRSRAHIAEIVALLGPPPQDLLAQGKLTHKFFSDDGESSPTLARCLNRFLTCHRLGTFSGGISLPPRTSLEQRETTLEGEDKEQFLRLVRKMLQWDADNRSSARELVDDEWIQEHTRT